MEFRQLTVFLTIAEELHFGRAAERLHLAQSSVSQQLQRLERDLGVQLIARTSHRVCLTPAGETFRTEARRVIDQAEHAVRAARETAAGTMETISIGFNFAAGQLVLPKTLARLHTEYPQVKTRLWEKLAGRGHRRFAVLAGPVLMLTAVERTAGFLDGLSDLGFPAPVLLHSRLDRDGGVAFRADRDLLVMAAGGCFQAAPRLPAGSRNHALGYCT